MLKLKDIQLIIRYDSYYLLKSILLLIYILLNLLSLLNFNVCMLVVFL